MIAVLKPNATKEQREHLISWLERQELEVHISEGKDYTVLGLVGDTSKIDKELLRRVAPHLGVRQDIQRQNLQRQPQAAAQMRRVPPLKGWLKLGLGKIGLHLRACRLGAVEQIRRIHSTGQGQRALWICVKIFLQCHHKPHLSASVTLILS